MPKQVYDAKKLLEFLRKWGDYSIADMIEREGKYGTFDPTPPVQPDIKTGDKVRHKDKEFYGIGIVRELSKSGKQALVDWPDYDKNYFRFGGPMAAYYRVDKLEVITDDQN